MVQIYDLKEKPELLESAAQMFWGQWGSEHNYRFYYDCMLHSISTESELPRFYIAMQHQSIIGMYALLRNDLVSRQDLCPWLACLYVAPEYRGQRGAALLQHAEQEARRKGYDRLYLCSGLDGYYEQFGWSHFANGYAVNGAETKIYEASLAARTLPDPLPVIQSLQQCPERREAFIAYVTEAWPAVKNAVIRQLDGSEATGATELPLTFLMVKHDRIIGFYQLVEQEQLVRKDLSPWIAPLFVDERERGQSLGAELLRHARKTAGRLGYGKVYLTTDHIGYYEKYGFREIGLSSFEWGRPSKIYEHDTL